MYQWNKNIRSWNISNPTKGVFSSESTSMIRRTPIRLWISWILRDLMSVISPFFSKSLLKITRSLRRFPFGSYIAALQRLNHVVHVQFHNGEQTAITRLHFLVDNTSVISIERIKNEVITAIHCGQRLTRFVGSFLNSVKPRMDLGSQQDRANLTLSNCVLTSLLLPLNSTFSCVETLEKEDSTFSKRSFSSPRRKL